MNKQELIEKIEKTLENAMNNRNQCKNVAQLAMSNGLSLGKIDLLISKEKQLDKPGDEKWN